jgi:hypothetical protein
VVKLDGLSQSVAPGGEKKGTGVFFLEMVKS